MAFPLQLLTSTPWHTVKVRYNITTVLEIWKKRRKQDPSKLSSVEKVLKALIKYIFDIILPKIRTLNLMMTLHWLDKTSYFASLVFILSVWISKYIYKYT